eukprot:15434197-Alexandrium_andersonii.AAC.1
MRRQCKRHPQAADAKDVCDKSNQADGRRCCATSRKTAAAAEAADHRAASPQQAGQNTATAQ